jgi:hypothetical protein
MVISDVLGQESFPAPAPLSRRRQRATIVIVCLATAIFGALLPATAALGRGSPGGYVTGYVTGFHHALFAGCAVSVLGAVGVIGLKGWG